MIEAAALIIVMVMELQGSFCTDKFYYFYHYPLPNFLDAFFRDKIDLNIETFSRIVFLSSDFYSIFQRFSMRVP